MLVDSSSLFLGMLLFWFLSFQYYKRYGKKTAKNLTFLCKVAPVYGSPSNHHLGFAVKWNLIVRFIRNNLDR